MLSELTKEMLAKLEMKYPAVAMKFCFERPADVPQNEKELALCQFVKEAQVTGRSFYTDAHNDNCMGKMMLGMIDIPPLEASGQAGFDFEVFRTPAANARLYHMLPRLVRGACNYVRFCPVSICDFDPDLIICVCDAPQADVIMRANAYISGDLWESRDSHVAGCAWMYVYPYVTGKINHQVVGMHHGQKLRKPYEDGMQIITIPYQKIEEVTKAMSEMHWKPISVREDEESQEELRRRIRHWGELEPNLILTQA